MLLEDIALEKLVRVKDVHALSSLSEHLNRNLDDADGVSVPRKDIRKLELLLEFQTHHSWWHLH